jgi:hypothetical protein
LRCVRGAGLLGMAEDSAGAHRFDCYHLAIILGHVRHPTDPPMPVSELYFDAASCRLSGDVYGAQVNHRAALDTLGAAVNEALYQGPRKAPVLPLLGAADNLLEMRCVSNT